MKPKEASWEREFDEWYADPISNPEIIRKVIRKELKRERIIVKKRYERRLRDLKDLNEEYDRKLIAETREEMGKALRKEFVKWWHNVPNLKRTGGTTYGFLDSKDYLQAIDNYLKEEK